MRLKMKVVIAIIVLLIVALLIEYNRLVRLRNKVKQSEAGIDVYLNQRFDLIPNLVECVKAYSQYENEVFTKIVESRNIYNQNKRINFEQANEINNNFNKILAIAEGYPELKVNEQYLNLQKNLTKIESQLQAARRIYNNDVTKYNTTIETVPNNIVANMFKFKKAELFQVEEYKRENIDIDIGEK